MTDKPPVPEVTVDTTEDAGKSVNSGSTCKVETPSSCGTASRDDVVAGLVQAFKEQMQVRACAFDCASFAFQLGCHLLLPTA